LYFLPQAEGLGCSSEGNQFDSELSVVPLDYIVLYFSSQAEEPDSSSSTKIPSETSSIFVYCYRLIN
jgi:hypothetical protein